MFDALVIKLMLKLLFYRRFLFTSFNVKIFNKKLYLCSNDSFYL